MRGKVEVGENDGTMDVLGGFLCLARKGIFSIKALTRFWFLKFRSSCMGFE